MKEQETIQMITKPILEKYRAGYQIEAPDFQGTNEEMTNYATGYLLLSGNISSRERNFFLGYEKSIKGYQIHVFHLAWLLEQETFSTAVLKGYAERMKEISLTALIHRMFSEAVTEQTESYLLGSTLSSKMRKEWLQQERIMTIQSGGELMHIDVCMTLDYKRKFYVPYLKSKDHSLQSEEFFNLMEKAETIWEYLYFPRISSDVTIKEYGKRECQRIYQKLMLSLMDIPEYAIVFSRLNRYALQSETFPDFCLHKDKLEHSVLDDLEKRSCKISSKSINKSD